MSMLTKRNSVLTEATERQQTTACLSLGRFPKLKKQIVAYLVFVALIIWKSYKDAGCPSEASANLDAM